MDGIELLVDGIGRSLEVCGRVVGGLGQAQVNWRPFGVANSITWLVWHSARQQDAQIAALARTEQVWLRDGWVERFGLDLPPASMGYGHTAEQASKVRVEDPSLLVGYLDAAVAATVGYLRTLSAGALDEVVDRRWSPPVTRGVRLVSIVDDAAQHAGQAAYVRGLLPAGLPA